MRRPAAALAAVLAVGAFLRFWRLDWALDERLMFPDEIIWLVRVSGFLPLGWASFDLDFSHTYPTLYGYCAGLATWAAWGLGLLRPAPDATWDALLVARVVAAVAGVVNVAAVAALGWRAFSAPVGVVAAAFAAVLPLEAVHVHYASVDGLLTLWFTLAALAALAVARGGGAGAALAVGLSAGFGFATKYTGLGALGALAAPLVLRARTDGWAAALRLAVAAGAGAVAGIAAGCPPCALRPMDLLAALRSLQELTATGDFLNARLVPSLGWVGTPYVYEVVASLPYAFGWPLWALVVAGVAVALRRRTPADAVLLGAAGTYFAAIGASSLVFPRYLMPLGPALVVLAARVAVALARRGTAGGAVVAAVWLWTLAYAASHVESASLAQQRDVARWIRERPGTEAGAMVATPRRAAEYFALTPFVSRAGLNPIVLADGQWLAHPARFFVVPEILAIGARRDAPDGPDARALARLEAGEGGWRRAAQWPISYLGRRLHASLDPGLIPGLGECGFTVYVRDGAGDG